MVRVAHLYLIVSEYFGDVRQSIWPTLKVISLYVCNSVCVRHRVRLTWPAPMVQQRKNPSGSTFRFISVGCVLLGSQATTEMQMLKNCKHKIKVQEEKKNTMCNSKQEPVFITMWVLLFIDLALNLMGYYVGTLSQHTVN